MAMDRLDWTALVGLLTLAGASVVLEPALVGAAFGGFLLSMAVWRLYGGRPWEALAWVVWVGGAVVLVFSPGGALFLLLFISSLIGGMGLLFASRRELLPDIWTAETDLE